MARRSSFAELTEIYRPNLGGDLFDVARPDIFYVPETFPTGTAPRVTIELPRRIPRIATIGIAAISCLALGIALGCAVALGDSPKLKVPAALEPAPAQAPIVMSIVPTLARRPALVAVRIDSEPAGGFVTLLDGTAMSALGTTPLDIELDPSRAYEVAVSLHGHVARVERVAPAAAQHITFALERIHHHHHDDHGPELAVEPVDVEPPASNRHTDVDLADPAND